MNRNSFFKNIKYFLIISIIFFSCAHPQKHNSSKQPNILLITTDQQNANMMSAAGNTNLHTPNMDRIANAGVMFKHSYCASPVCGPARSSILTGLMPHQTGVQWNGDSLKKDVKTVGEIFRKNGYNTFWAGKWHLPESYPQKSDQHNEYGLETKLANQEFTSKIWRGYLNAYYRLTEKVDQEIGKVLNTLEENGLDENTIIVFTSDHGDGAAAHKWAAKLSLYQESSTVPLVISWPGEIPRGKIDRQNLVSNIDIVPTLCDYANIKSDEEFTGKSLRPVIENENADWREYLVVELADFKPDRSRKGRMVRSQNFKYNIYNQGAGNEQLFLLSEDPGETYNLAHESEYEEIIQKHREYLREWMNKTNDDFNLVKYKRN